MTIHKKFVWFSIFFFQFSKWAIKSDKNTDSWLNMLIDFFLCVVFFLLQKIEFEFFFKTNASQASFCPYNLLSQRKMQTHDTRDETLRRKSSGGITDGLNWLKRHHNFSFFIKFFFTYFFISSFFFLFLHLNVVWWHDLYAKNFF